MALFKQTHQWESEVARKSCQGINRHLYAAYPNGSGLEDRITQALGDLLDLAQFLGADRSELLNRALTIETKLDEYPPAKVGQVSFFNPAEEKNFGWLADGTWFHYKQGIKWVCNGSDHPADGGFPSQPLQGNTLIYARMESRKGPFAAWWGFQREYLEALEQIKNRKTFRVLRPGTGQLAWEGKDLAKLRVLYPQDFSLDEYGYKVLMFDDQDQKWVPVTDPR